LDRSPEYAHLQALATRTHGLAFLITCPVIPATFQPSTPDYFSDSLFPVFASNGTAIMPSAVEIQSLALKRAALKSGENTAGIIWFIKRFV
jgi:hypothetical protein